MAKEVPEPEEKRLRKEKKERKAKKRAETDGVHKSSSSSKKDKSDRKEKKSKKEKSDKTAQSPTPNTTALAPEPILAEEAQDVDMTTSLLNTLQEEKPGTLVVKDEKGDLEIKIKQKPLIGALVPFANPLADEKVGKKVLKSVKKAAKNKTLKRGVKEVVKALRKSPPSTTSTNSTSATLPPAIVIIAADISPMDVISHLPVLCEDHSIPYLFVPSRVELGAASSTKRPTSVVMIARERGPPGKAKVSKDKDEDGEVDGEGEGGKEDWGEVYADLVKVVVKAGRGVKV